MRIRSFVSTCARRHECPLLSPVLLTPSVAKLLNSFPVSAEHSRVELPSVTVASMPSTCARFPPANRAEAASLSDLKKCLFGPVPAGAAAGKKSAKKKKTQPSFLTRLSDFQLLVFLSRQVSGE